MKDNIIKQEDVKKESGIKWNFSMGLIHGIFFTGGRAFISPDTILPVFLNHFTNCKSLIGLSATIFGGLGGIGNVIPQLFVAHRVENKILKRPVLRVAITIRALCWGFLALTTYFFADSHPDLSIFFLFLFLITFTLMGGIAAVPFYDIWGKALPSKKRGTFFGYRQLGGGLLAIASGYIAKIILGHNVISFPNNFVLLFLLAFLFMSIAFIALGSVKEPVEEVHKIRLTFKSFLKKSSQIFQNDENYRIFLLVQILAGTQALALPFYVIYAREILQIRLEMVGTLLLAQMLGSVLSNLFWAPISDRCSNKAVLQASTFLGLIVPLIALMTPQHLPQLFIILFIVLGFFISGKNIGTMNYLLDLAPTKERPAYLSINSTLSFPVMIYPLFGGIFIQFFSYTLLFTITLITIFLGFIISLKLKCVRK
jgi:MFS family permease